MGVRGRMSECFLLLRLFSGVGVWANETRDRHGKLFPDF